MSSRIEDYALIGDRETAALVGRDGSIDWLCWPRFDSYACFAALLGSREHGRWQIAPRDKDARVHRRYRPNTLILETRFETKDGAVALIDFMPRREGTSSVVRLVVGERGRVAMCCELILRFGFGLIVPWVTRLEDGTQRAIAGPDMTVLRTPVHLRGENLTTVGEFVIEAGDTVPFVMSYSSSNLPPPKPADPRALLEETEAFWSEWAAQCRPAGRWSDLVVRSLITLKALTYRPTGGVVAAPTTSLPEQIGGTRNWDYRYCWLRDATLTLLALMHAGFYEEALAWREWLLRAVAGSPDQVQIMYGIAGERFLHERTLPWLPGYENSVPVRIGNAAFGQVQLDIFGEVMDADYQARRGGLTASESGWNVQLALMEHLERVWMKPDASIWEIRDQWRHFTYSKVMAWVAVDRERRGFRASRTARKVAQNARPYSPGRLRARLRCRKGQFRSVLRVEETRCVAFVAAERRLSADHRSAHRRDCRGDRARITHRRIRPALRCRRSTGWVAAGRGSVSRLQLLARRCLFAAEPPARGGAPVRAGHRPVQRRRPAQRGI
jgi:GH15 family glucan-1,4-alpha-glucosidase